MFTCVFPLPPQDKADDPNPQGPSLVALQIAALRAGTPDGDARSTSKSVISGRSAPSDGKSDRKRRERRATESSTGTAAEPAPAARPVKEEGKTGDKSGKDAEESESREKGQFRAQEVRHFKPHIP